MIFNIPLEQLVNRVFQIFFIIFFVPRSGSRFLPAIGDVVLGQMPTKFDSENLPNFVSIGVDELEVGAIWPEAFLLFFEKPRSILL